MSAPTPMRTRLSIIVPVHNEAQTTGQVLDRLSELAPGDLDTEVIVVDDGSTDGVGYGPRRRDEGTKVSWTGGLAAIGTLLRCRLDAGPRRPGAATASADAHF
jgi:Glycosyl transferase family 2